MGSPPSQTQSPPRRTAKRPLGHERFHQHR